jgi:hypothetical protein
MDIYRFFHPHHNPRLHNTPLRQQELGELVQAAAELRKALDRARKRTERRSAGPIATEHFSEILKAARFLETSLQSLVDVHPGDSEDTMRALIEERSGSSGWDAWTALAREQLATTASPADARMAADGEKEKPPSAAKNRT